MRRGIHRLGLPSMRTSREHRGTFHLLLEDSCGQRLIKYQPITLDLGRRLGQLDHHQFGINQHNILDLFTESSTPSMCHDQLDKLLVDIMVTHLLPIH
jgi:hypothetical protein